MVEERRCSLIDLFGSAVCVTCVTPLTTRKDRIVCRPGPAAEAGSLVVLEGLLDFGTGIHDERTVLTDRLADRFPLQQQEL